MPLYEYACPACRHEWESLLDRWDAPAPTCPACGASRSKRKLSKFAVVATPATASRSTPGPCGSDDCACRRAERPS